MASAHVDTFCRDHLPARELWPEMHFDLPELQYPEQLNAAVELLAGPPAEHPCVRGGTVDGGVAFTYGELRECAARIAAVLVADGLVPGNRVLLRGPNEPWLVACWLGVLLAGGVAVATMPMLRAGEVAAIAELSRPTLALCHERFTEALPDLPTITYPAALDARCAAQDGSFRPVATAADDVALLAFTSGTTGRPKATMHQHRDVLAIADTFGAHIVAIRPDDVVTGTPPIAFTFGLGGLVVFPMRVGASTLLVERTTPEQLADTVAEQGVTVLFTAPTAYRAILAAGKAERLTGLRRAVSAGEALPATVWRAVHDAIGLKIIDGIGSTEMLHVFISAADDDIRPGTTGRAVPGYRATILDDNGNPVPDGTPGHLAVQGPTGCRYLDGDRQTTYVRHGWNLTGDTFARDADGYFTYLARSDDMIVSSGYNISGPEVEQALLGHPDVVDVAVVGRPDEQRGAVVTAFVVLRAGAAADAAALQEFTKAAIAPYKYPRVVEFVSELPRTSTGKLQRYVLRDAVKGAV